MYLFVTFFFSLERKCLDRIAEIPLCFVPTFSALVTVDNRTNRTGLLVAALERTKSHSARVLHFDLVYVCLGCDRSTLIYITFSQFI